MTRIPRCSLETVSPIDHLSDAERERIEICNEAAEVCEWCAESCRNMVAS